MGRPGKLFAGSLTLALLLAAEHLRETIGFDEFYENRGIQGLAFSARLKSLEGKTVRVRGHMAPPLKAMGNFFVLTRRPVALCPFCDSDKDWPADIFVAYLDESRTFTLPAGAIEVTGTLELGYHKDEATGFVSRLRLRHSKWGPSP